MRKHLSLTRLIETNKENLNNNQLFINLIEEKVHRRQLEMQERHLPKQEGDDVVVKKSLVHSANH
ncbi:hypothetical protein [Peribacillus muralis]|uniref:hypothetical protein n=1 Tax=Peribacillus muralis TaxID=264697 RepID=UPI00366AB2C5